MIKFIRLVSFAFLEEGCIHIDVMDTGIGIREENLDTIFEPFVRLDTSFQEGSGIGLPL
ncbi:ATP-binding protein [Metabacillus sp. RGM 3146]|uniref:ATP-binding protein n=1 Tax=Metabacillus sp. RGM 3146 TaxID=3401092 RepID=UPI003B9A048D